jgi:hypothetical protein
MPYVRIRSAAIALANQDRSEFLAWTAFGQLALRFLPVKRVVPRFAEAAASHPLLLTWVRLASAAGKLRRWQIKTTTLIAAESIGRSCYAIEMDPRYVDVAVRRWHEFTGKQATLDGEGRTFKQVTRARRREVA